MSMELDLSP